MSNRKILKLVNEQGYCCLWAFFRAGEKRDTADLWKLIDKGCTKRAVQQQRARYRDEQYHCENSEKCLKKRQR